MEKNVTYLLPYCILFCSTFYSETEHLSKNTTMKLSGKIGAYYLSNRRGGKQENKIIEGKATCC